MTERDGRELSDVIRYAVNSEKTQQAENEDCTVVHRFVSGINCSPATARDEMLAVKKRFGKENGTVAYGRSSGRNGNYSTNYQISGRELMTPDEVRMLDNRYALLFIRGEPPIMDEKYNILKHPNVSLTTDGGAAPYEHGGTEHAVATLSLAGIPAEDIPDMEDTEPDYELLSDEEIEALFSI